MSISPLLELRMSIRQETIMKSSCPALCLWADNILTCYHHLTDKVSKAQRDQMSCLGSELWRLTLALFGRWLSLRPTAFETEHIACHPERAPDSASVDRVLLSLSMEKRRFNIEHCMLQTYTSANTAPALTLVCAFLMNGQAPDS